MAKTLLEQLPEIVRRGREEAEKILENLEGRHRVALQTREWVLPAKDSAMQEWISANQRQTPLGKQKQPGRISDSVTRQSGATTLVGLRDDTAPRPTWLPGCLRQRIIFPG